MPYHSFHFGPQISLRTSQNWTAKNEDQVRSYPRLKVLPLGSMDATVHPEHLGSLGPVLPFRCILPHILRRLFHDLYSRKIWQVPDLLGKCAVCPLDDLFKMAVNIVADAFNGWREIAWVMKKSLRLAGEI